ncbi:MAG: hypothetical protein ACK55I_12185, partial [bacterium]
MGHRFTSQVDSSRLQCPGPNITGRKDTCEESPPTRPWLFRLLESRSRIAILGKRARPRRFISSSKGSSRESSVQRMAQILQMAQMNASIDEWEVM